MTEKPSVFAFVRAFGVHWSEYMSGIPSVPLMIVALFLPNHSVAIATGLLGIICAALAAYFVWRPERRRICELEELLAPQLTLTFEPESPWLVRVEHAQTPPRDNRSAERNQWVTTDSYWYRIEVKNRGARPAHKCNVWLREVEYFELGRFHKVGFGNSHILRWAETNSDPYGARDINHGTRMFVDLFSIDEEHKSLFVKVPPGWMIHEGLFAKTGKYKITLVATSEDGGSIEKQLLLDWSGSWNQVKLSAIETFGEVIATNAEVVV